MGTRRGLAILLAAGGLALAAPSSAQFVTLSRCHAAFPCSEPFGLQNRPDPLIAGPYTSAPTSAIAGHIELKKNPEVKIDRRPADAPVDDAVAASVRSFLKRHPAPRRPEENPVEEKAPAGPTPDPKR